MHQKKKNRLVDQLNEADILHQNTDRRAAQVRQMLSKYLTQVGLLGSKCLIKSHQLRILGAHAHFNGLFKIPPQNFSTTSQIQMSKDDKQEPKKKGNKLLWIGAFTIGFGFYLLSDFDEFVEDVKPPKMEAYGIDIFPLLKKVFKVLPDSTRKNFAIKMVCNKYQIFLIHRIKI